MLSWSPFNQSTFQFTTDNTKGEIGNAVVVVAVMVSIRTQEIRVKTKLIQLLFGV